MPDQDMTPEEFRANLAELGFTQAEFARFLTLHGHPARHVDRTVRRWAEVGPPGEVIVLLHILLHHRVAGFLLPPHPPTRKSKS